MPIDIPENDFYICLLSNNSLHYYSENSLSEFTNKLARSCKLNQNWRVGIIEIAIPEYEDSRQEYDIMYIYTDIIKPRVIGDKSARYLRVVPTNKSERILRFNHIEYCPVEKTVIESISIKITDGQGELANFKSNYIPTYVMLHFKTQ